MRCSKYLCILNSWVQDEGTEVFGVRTGVGIRETVAHNERKGGKGAV